MYTKGKRKDTLPPYEASTNGPLDLQRIEIPASGGMDWNHGRNPNSPQPARHRRGYFEEYITGPIRTFSGDSMRRLAGMLEPYSPSPFSGGSILGEPIHDAPESILSPAAPPPPSYFASVKPMLLWLDGGGNKVVVETHFLEDLMHRLAWDLKFTSSQPGRMANGGYFIPPNDCFDWVASCGCGTIIAFAIACGMRVKEIREKFLEMTSALRVGSEDQIHSHLESMIPTRTQKLLFDGQTIMDSPTLVNIWVPAEADVAHNPGICVLKESPLRARLLPLIMREIRKELNGTAEFLDCTVQFLQDACPVFSECSFLLSIGSGDVPQTSAEQTWWDWWWGRNTPPAHPPLPPCVTHKRNNIIPLEAYSNPATYIRLSPRFFLRTEQGIKGPDDWAEDVTEILAMTTSYISKQETKLLLDRVNTMLKWREIKRESKAPPTSNNHASTSRQPGHL
ncbi:hypothetical protein M408DRAFT_327803 [Serendipita vermifera MAFF 305830]|uniref:PNPLA domain-containing protein n=1 Tax=Serendipita vermifera MAFF 305830 TaxID=933852 RepID=A0A0C2XPF0_SERVB|nr:hypothetical protein M408DRAFT_327803 [Serendipita vermifera MAFF 305830]